MAGKVESIDLSTDKEGNSRGFAIIEYDHPVEAVQVRVTSIDHFNFHKNYFINENKF